MRHTAPQPFATTAAAIAPRHIRRGPCFVNEDQPLGDEIELTVGPVLSLFQDVGAVLFRRVSSLFLRVTR
jgi:hypothetical protein